MKAFKEVSYTEFNPSLLGKVIKFNENNWTGTYIGIVKVIERGFMTVVGDFGDKSLYASKMVSGGGFIKVLEMREEDDDATN